MPQWEFLNFLAEEARRYPAFRFAMRARAEDLLWENGRVAGVRAQTPDGALDVRADLTIAADGRESVLRERANLDVVELGAPMDVLWLRLTKHGDDPHETFGYIRDGRIMALIDRGAYWQCAYVIPKGTLAELQRRGLEQFRRDIGAIVPFLRRARRRDCELGRREAADRTRESAARNGIVRACFASATPPTRCRRSAASVSTSRFKTRSPLQTCWLRSCAREISRSPTCARFNGAASRPRG